MSIKRRLGKLERGRKDVCGGCSRAEGEKYPRGPVTFCVPDPDLPKKPCPECGQELPSFTVKLGD